MSETIVTRNYNRWCKKCGENIRAVQQTVTSDEDKTRIYYRVYGVVDKRVVFFGTVSRQNDGKWQAWHNGRPYAVNQATLCRAYSMLIVHQYSGGYTIHRPPNQVLAEQWYDFS